MLRGPGVPAGSSLPGCQAGRPVALATVEVTHAPPIQRSCQQP